MRRALDAALYVGGEVVGFVAGALALFGLACLAVAGLVLATVALLCAAIREEFCYLLDRLRGRA